MNHPEIERKWQQIWADKEIYRIDLENVKPEDKWYVLVMFSYPSGDKLHVGHWYNYGPTDTYARFKRMNGKTVLQPMGFDAFGLPAENYAIKTGVHPNISTEKNIAYMTKQLNAMGAMYHWDNDVVTCRPDYYKWNQWLFLKLLEHDLAYKSEAPVNWCPNDKTVLANEQVIDGACERCGTTVIRKNLTQWFFRITKYADELLSGLDTIDWPESTKAKQREWIGRSIGAEIEFDIVGYKISVRVFTTRPDTLFGATFMTLAPELDLVQQITTDDQRSAVEAYIEQTRKRSEVDRLKGDEKTGVFTGAYAVNPINGEEIQIWISDYVLATYGTGAVMAVPGHDERDFEFAGKFGLPIRKVILEKGKEPASPLIEAYTGEGILIHSGTFDGQNNIKAKTEIVKALGKKAEFKTNYKLRDWLISRQRYWGTPIPVLYDAEGNIKPVSLSELPVTLPTDVEFKPDGESPLKTSESFLKVTDPETGQVYTRDTDTMDTFVCSSWYYLRYASPFHSDKPFDTDQVDAWMPVDQYVGGADHAVMHLLYARFIHKALRDMGYVNSDEPFQRLTHQGMILGSDGKKMSKRDGNVVNPDIYVEEYGADVFRCALMFGFAYELGGPFDEKAIQSIVRWFKRIERMVTDHGTDPKSAPDGTVNNGDEKQLMHVLHNSIKGVTEDLDRLQFNTAISRLMEAVNAYYKYIDGRETINTALLRHMIQEFIRLLAPFAPHFAEELWERCGFEGFVTIASWPAVNPAFLELDEVTYVIQINGKKRAEISLPRTADRVAVEMEARSHKRVKTLTDGLTIRKIIVVPQKLVNIVAT